MSILYYFTLQRKKLSNGFLTTKKVAGNKELTPSKNDPINSTGTL